MNNKGRCRQSRQRRLGRRLAAVAGDRNPKTIIDSILQLLFAPDVSLRCQRKRARAETGSVRVRHCNRDRAEHMYVEDRGAPAINAEILAPNQDRVVRRETVVPISLQEIVCP